MKQIIAVILLFLGVIQSNAQVETNYYSKSDIIRSNFKYSRKNIIVKTMPSFDLEKMRKEDAEMEGEDVPFRFGKGFDVNYSFDDGQWENVEGGRLWTISFKSEKALSLNYVFGNFYLPEGASLYIENQNETVLYGPVTSDALSKKYDSFLTDIIPGDQSTIYLFEPLEKKGESKLTVKRVVHGYRGIVFDEKYGTEGRSSPCNHDVACLPAYEKESNAVALVLLSDGDEWCSGSLLMNTNFTFDPYFLTAFHCIDWPNNNGYLSDSEKNAAENWMFKFCFKKASCNGSNLVTDYTYNKADFCSAWYTTDFALMKLKGTVSQNGNLTWLGWDRTGNIPSSTTCIHHPAGDVMKISADYDAATSISLNGGTNNFWQVDFDYGITQGGSSGSPLLNQYKRVVGQLYGGPHPTDTCDWTIREYGKLNFSWTGGGTNDTRLSNWLDPIGTGQTTIDSFHPISISGPSVPCNNSVYSINNLPIGYTVTWSWQNPFGPVLRSGISDESNGLRFPDDPPFIYGPILQQNTPSTNMCTLDKNGFDYINNTIVATIKKNGTTVCTLTKHVNTGQNFSGFYAQAAHQYTNWYYPGVSGAYFGNESTIYLYRGSTITLTSSKFVGATLSYSGTTPYGWTHSGNTVSFEFSFYDIYPRGVNYIQGPASLTITGTYPNSCECFEFTVIGQLPQGYTLTSGDSPDMGLNISSLSGQAYSITCGATDGWELSVIDSVTGETIYRSHVDGSEKTLNTTGWKSGIYIIKATVGDQTQTQKLSVK